MNIEIANKLQQMRKKNNLSQEELAAKMRVTRQAVSKWERAESAPDMENLILLAKLYGVTIDELLNISTSPEAVSAGISLKKDDYGYTEDPVREKVPDNYTDEEIFPGVNTETENSVPQGAPFGADIDEEEKKATGAAPQQDDLMKNIEKAGRAIGDVLNAAGQKINDTIKNAENAEKNADGKTESWKTRLDRELEKLDREFDKLGDNMDDFGDKLGNAMDNFGDKLDRKLNKAFGEKNHECFEEDAAPKKHKEPTSLFDKLFPLFVLFLFFCTIPINLAHPGWTLFLLIPLYYTTKNAIKKRDLLLFCYPVFCVLVYFTIGGYFDVFIPTISDNWYGFAWLIFLTIPPFYTAIPAVRKRNPLIFCYPVLCVLIWLGVGLFASNLGFDSLSNWWFNYMWLPTFATIPFYYIIFTHLREKKKNK